MRRKILQELALVFFCLPVACGSSDSGESEESEWQVCTATFSTVAGEENDSGNVYVVGDFNNWSPDSYELPLDETTGNRTGRFVIGPGRYAYRFLHDDGSETLDESNPLTIFGRDGREHSLLIQRDCNVPYGELEVKSLENGVLTVHLNTAYQKRVKLGVSAHIDDEPVFVDSQWLDGSTIELSMSIFGATGLKRLEVTMEDSRQQQAKATLKFHADETTFRWEDAIVYQIVTDRFRRGSDEELDTTQPITHRMGGDFAGIESAIKRGYFESLGVNTLWISPANTNVAGEWEGFDGRVYESYHGYWPIAPREVDPRWGGEEALRSLVDTAHDHGMRLILDIVPNHVHLEHPYFVEHSEAWFNSPQGDCVCGRECDWGSDIEHCWFTEYLPDLNWKNSEVLDTVIGDAVWWLDHFDLDGLRVDAVAMMPRLMTRHLRYEVERKLGKDLLRPYLIGETFTGSDGRDDIRWYLGPYGLSGQFDFPLMWSVRSVIAQGQGEMGDLLDEADASRAAWEGSGAVMGLMLGNHDVPRFLSVANGDVLDDGQNPPEQPSGEAAYRRMEVAHAFLMTQRGAVILYYGDDIGLAGGGDPDNRRPMTFDLEWNEHQLNLFKHVKKLAKLRKQLHSLRYGERTDLLRKPDVIAYSLADEQDSALVILSRSPDARTYKIPLNDYETEKGWYSGLEDCMGSGSISLSEKRLQVVLEPYAIMVLAPKKVCYAIQ